MRIKITKRQQLVDDIATKPKYYIVLELEGELPQYLEGLSAEAIVELYGHLSSVLYRDGIKPKI